MSGTLKVVVTRDPNGVSNDVEVDALYSLPKQVTPECSLVCHDVNGDVMFVEVQEALPGSTGAVFRFAFVPFGPGTVSLYYHVKGHKQPGVVNVAEVSFSGEVGA